MSRELIAYVLPWLVDHPEEAEITEVEGDRPGETIIEISVHPDDMGKVIGRRGRVIQSLRVLAKAAGQRAGTSYGVEVVD